MSMKTTKIERGNLRFWWVNQLFSVKLTQKFFCRMKTFWIIKFFGSSTFNKLNRFHQKTDWVNFVRKQDLCVLLKLDNISWPKTLVILDNFVQWLVVNTLFLETIYLHNQKDGFKEISELDLYWKSRPVFSTSHMKLKFELSPWTNTILILGSEFPMEWSNTWSIVLKTIQKFLRIHKKTKFHKQARVWLQPGQRQKQNFNRERTCWDDSNHTNTPKKMDWHWTIKTRSWLVRSLEESYQSTSTQPDVTARRRWSNWILQDKISSSRSSFTITELVWWSMESLFGCRRRIQTKISVLLW